MAGFIGNVPAEKYTALQRQTFSSPTGTSHTLSYSVTNSDDLLLYINNVKQDPADYTASGTSLTTPTLVSGDEMYALFYGRATETVNPPDSSVSSAKIIDGAIVNADINASAGIARTKLANPGAWVLIGTQEASSDASLTQTGLDSTYDTYACVISNMVPATDAQALRLRLGDSGGVDTGASDYAYHHANSVDSGTGYGTGGNATGASFLNMGGNVGNAAGEGVGSVFYIHTPQDGTTNIIMSGVFVAHNNGGTLYGGHWLGSRLSSIAVDRIQIYFGSGNIASGRFSVYGVAHA